MNVPRTPAIAALVVGPLALATASFAAPAEVPARGTASTASSATASASAPASATPPPAAPEKPAKREKLSDESTQWGDRTLGGHTFPFPILQPETAFITTHFGVQEGFVVASYPKLPAGSLGTYDLQMTGYAQQIGLGVKVTDFLGVFVNANGQLVSGTDVPSIVLGNNAFTINGEGGAVVRIVRSDESGTQISVRLSGGPGLGRNLGVSNLISHLTKGDLSPVLNGNVGNYVLVPTSSWTVAGSVLAAKSVIPEVGLLASLEARHIGSTQSPYDQATNRNIDQSIDTNQVSATVALSIDGSPDGIPIALQPEYQLVGASVNGPGFISNTYVEYFLAVGLYYTGRRHLQVGIGGEMQLAMPPIQGINAAGNPAQSGNPSVLGGQFILRYVW